MRDEVINFTRYVTVHILNNYNECLFKICINLFGDAIPKSDFLIEATWLYLQSKSAKSLGICDNKLRILKIEKKV